METALLSLDPLVPWQVLAPLAGLAALVSLFALLRRARGAVGRTLLFVLLTLVLANPSLVRERREPVKDLAVVVFDQSPSQQIADRLQQGEMGLAGLVERLAKFPDLDVRVVRAGAAGVDLAPVAETRLFEPVANAFGDVPRKRRAGTILITDGQVHDVPPPEAAAGEYGPIHVLLTGTRREVDRRIEVIKAPSYGLVGKPVSITIRVVDDPAEHSPMAEVRIGHGGGPSRVARVPVGHAVPFEFTLQHGGENVMELEVTPVDGELTLANNRTAVVVNAVRDRLRVLLVSGEPHPGERTWRSLLKADPSVDLVHFTILRPPEKQDGTPIRELSLIAFPIRELFEIKLSEFDLIIFDRYRQRGVLPQVYLENIAHYVQDGGALLESSGPTYSSPFSLYRTPLGAVLPGPPTGRVLDRPFQPAVTDLGQRHPVTADLPGAAAGSGGAPNWGRWFRLNEVTAGRGEVVMVGNERPLLILDRVGEGRVAQLASDQIWLWSRGFEGGGPQAELLRRVAHWLMREPELEEDALRARAEGSKLVIERRSLRPDARPIEINTPGGTVKSVRLLEAQPGRAMATVPVQEPGVYRVSDGQRVALAVVGSLNLPELAQVHATEDRVRPVVAASDGGLFWLADLPHGPDLRRTRPERDQSGRDWLGLRANGDFVVTGVTSTTLMPLPVVVLLLLGAMIGAWLREAR